MAKESKDKAPRERTYIYRKCPTCGVKLHVCAYRCNKCGGLANRNSITGEWDDMTYGSTDPSNKIYNLNLCDVDRCMQCHNTTVGTQCEYAYCFGTGKGRCDMCNRYEYTRYLCCQAKQKENRAGIAAATKVVDDGIPF